MFKKILFAWPFCALTGFSSAAETPAPAMTAEQFDASLKYRSGEVVLKDGLATLKVPDSFRYLGPQDTERVLVQAWGNPQGGGTLGMILPAGSSVISPQGWGVIITYEGEGYVSDADADRINYGDLLKQMQEDAAAANEERRKQGYPSIEIAGWAEAPRYDKTAHKLYWAKDLRFGDDARHTLNYNIRVLGRHGVLVLNAVAGMDQLASVKQDMQQILAFTDFNPGHGYTDFNAGTDKVAAYGLAALVAGGIAAKAGLFAKLLPLLIAAKKFIIIAAAAVAGLFAKLFRRNKGGGPAGV